MSTGPTAARYVHVWPTQQQSPQAETTSGAAATRSAVVPAKAAWVGDAYILMTKPQDGDGNAYHARIYYRNGETWYDAPLSPADS